MHLVSWESFTLTNEHIVFVLTGFFVVAGFIFRAILLAIWEFCVAQIRHCRGSKESIYQIREKIMMDQLVIVMCQIASLNMPASHGFDHARVVFLHALCALEAYVDQPGMERITMDNKFEVLLAAMLHDVDDRKYFKNHKNFENARALMTCACISAETQASVTKMIGYVSCSKNLNRIPDEAKSRPWILIPRYCDRLEAIGWVGIIRAWEYTEETKGELWLPETARAKNREDLWKIAIPERYKEYFRSGGKSNSLVDHFYDKLLHLPKEEMGNSYLNDEKVERFFPMAAFCIHFGKCGKVEKSVLEFAKKRQSEEDTRLIKRVASIMTASESMIAAILKITNMTSIHTADN